MVDVKWDGIGSLVFPPKDVDCDCCVGFVVVATTALTLCGSLLGMADNFDGMMV